MPTLCGASSWSKQFAKISNNLQNSPPLAGKELGMFPWLSIVIYKTVSCGNSLQFQFKFQIQFNFEVVVTHYKYVSKELIHGIFHGMLWLTSLYFTTALYLETFYCKYSQTSITQGYWDYLTSQNHPKCGWNSQFRCVWLVKISPQQG